MMLLLIRSFLENTIGIDPQQIQGFKYLSMQSQKEILDAFPVPASVGYVSASSSLGHHYYNIFACTCAHQRKKRKGPAKEKAEGGTKKKPKEDPKEKALRVSVVLPFIRLRLIEPHMVVIDGNFVYTCMEPPLGCF